MNLETIKLANRNSARIKKLHRESVKRRIAAKSYARQFYISFPEDELKSYFKTLHRAISDSFGIILTATGIDTDTQP